MPIPPLIDHQVAKVISAATFFVTKQTQNGSMEDGRV